MRKSGWEQIRGCRWADLNTEDEVSQSFARMAASSSLRNADGEAISSFLEELDSRLGLSLLFQTAVRISDESTMNSIGPSRCFPVTSTRPSPPQAQRQFSNLFASVAQQLTQDTSNTSNQQQTPLHSSMHDNPPPGLTTDDTGIIQQKFELQKYESVITMATSSTSCTHTAFQPSIGPSPECSSTLTTQNHLPSTPIANTIQYATTAVQKKPNKPPRKTFKFTKLVDTPETITLSEARETPWKERINSRNKQIALGKATLGYRNYVAFVPVKDRKDRDPRTPNVYDRLSKKQFDDRIYVWKMALHAYDSLRKSDCLPPPPPPSPDEDQALAEFAVEHDTLTGT